MSNQTDSGRDQEIESPSGLLLSVESLQGDQQLGFSSRDTTDSAKDTDGSDSVEEDTDGSDATDADGSDAKDADGTDGSSKEKTTDTDTEDELDAEE